MTKQQFTALPDTTVLVLRDGTRVTAGELRLKRRQRVDQAKANSQARGAEAKTWFDANYAKLLQDQQADADAHNAKFRAGLARLKTSKSIAVTVSPQAIQQEAIQLIQRAKTASPAEQVLIEKRAGVLLQELQQLPK